MKISETIFFISKIRQKNVLQITLIIMVPKWFHRNWLDHINGYEIPSTAKLRKQNIWKKNSNHSWFSCIIQIIRMRYSLAVVVVNKLLESWIIDFCFVCLQMLNVIWPAAETFCHDRSPKYTELSLATFFSIAN